MKQEAKVNWLSVRNQDRINFIIMYGILRVGLIFTLIVTFLDYTRDCGFTVSHLKGYLSQEWFLIPFRGIVFGILWGMVTWKRNKTLLH